MLFSFFTRKNRQVIFEFDVKHTEMRARKGKMGIVICLIFEWENGTGFPGAGMPKGGSGKNK